MNRSPAEAGVPLNVPNSLTILRILLIPLFIGFLLHGWYGYALLILALAGLTDGLDGTIARVSNQRTRLGAYLDPLADKLLLTSAFITLAVLNLVPLWLVVLVVGRDFLLMIGALLLRLTDSRMDMSPSILGKGTTVLQLLYVVLVVVLAAWQMDLRIIEPVLYAMVTLTVLSGIHYLYRGVSYHHTGGA